MTKWYEAQYGRWFRIGARMQDGSAYYVQRVKPWLPFAVVVYPLIAITSKQWLPIGFFGVASLVVVGLAWPSNIAILNGYRRREEAGATGIVPVMFGRIWAAAFSLMSLVLLVKVAVTLSSG